jgi:hypothetical protein
VTKLQDWAYRIGRAALPAPSTADFIRGILVDLSLDDLAASLKKNKKGRLIVPAA